MENEESQNDVDELVKSVAEQLDAGIPKKDIINRLSEAGLGSFEAEEFVNRVDGLRYQARKQAGTKDLGCGFLLLAVGVAITLGTWVATEAGGSYWVMWGAMAFGVFYILRGLYRKVTSTTDAGTRLRWVLGSIILVGGFVGGGVAITNMMNPPELTPPDDSFIVWEDNSAWENEILGTVRVTGVITNTHSEWSIKNVKIEIEAEDVAHNVIETFDVPVTPSTILPGGKGVYFKTVQVSYSCEYVAPFMEWEWVPPK